MRRLVETPGSPTIARLNTKNCHSGAGKERREKICDHSCGYARPVCLAMAPSAAQDWPAKPIRLIVPYPAGGGTDVVARMVADRLSKLLNQPIFVENRGGANGAVGLQALKQSEPDGYTLGDR